MNRIFRATQITLLLLLLGGESARAASDRGGGRMCGGLFGANIIKTGGMEEWKNGAPVGWTVEGECFSDDGVFAAGKRSARLEVPKKGTAKLTSDPIPASPGSYFVRYLFKQNVPPAQEGKYARESYVTIDCLDAEGKKLRSAYVFGSEFPVPDWLYRHRILTAPAGTEALRISLFFVNHVGEDKPCALWLDEVAVCSYHPPGARRVNIGTRFVQQLGRSILSAEDGGPGCRVFEGGIRYAEANSVYTVPDPKSASGIARHWPAYKKGECFWYSESFRGVVPGVYRLTLRVRAGPEDKKSPDRPVIQAVAHYPHINAIGWHQFFGSDLKHDDQYQSLNLDFVKPDWGAMNLRIDTLQEAPEFWLDYVLLQPLCRFTDADSQAVFPALFSVRQPPPDFPNRQKPRVLLLQGLCAEYFRLDEALKLAGLADVERILYKITYGDGPLLDGMPQTWENMYRHDIVILADVGTHALSAGQRFMLREWARNGGGLIVLGGKAAYGGSGLRGTFLDDVLPVEVSESRFDIVPNAAPLSVKAHAVTNTLNWNRDIACPYVHELRIRQGAEQIVSAGKRPFLAVWSFGNGRVACICAPPYGIAPRGEVSFWEWKDWPALMRNVITWVSKPAGDR